MRAVSSLLGLLVLAGCVGDIRTTNPARTAQEELLLSTAAEHAIASMDSSVLAGKRVFVDADRLDPIDRGYVVGAFQEWVAHSGAKFIPDRDKSDTIIEVRSAVLAEWDGKWGIGIPMFFAPGIVLAVDPNMSTSNIPDLIDITYELRQGYARIQAFAYDKKTETFLAGWRDAWGRAFVGLIFDNIWPEGSITTTLNGYTQ